MPESTSSSTGTDRHLWVTILAGGVGSRFWPVSTPDRPKQLLPLGSDRPLIVDTVDRARALDVDERIRILTGEHLVDPIGQVLPDLGEASFLVEPRARGTGPVLAWAAWTVQREDPDAVLVSLHSDHVIEPEEDFVREIEQAERVARDHDSLVTLAVRPDRPEIGYGYIQPGRQLTGDGPSRASRVAAFHEKPDQDTARRYVEEGYLWNSGIFVWRADRFLREVREHAPEIGDHLVRLERGDVAGFFDAVPPISVDEAVLERSERVAAVEATFRWDDVGNWEALARTRPADDDGNVAVGETHVVDGSGNILYTDDRPLVLFGVEDLVVVRTPEATLVTTRSLAPRLKELLERLPDHLRNP